jgi:hypothetical protein
MRVTKDGLETLYDGDNGLRAVVTKKIGGYTVHAMWDRDGKSWIGGYGEGTPIPLAEATDLAERFVTGRPVPEELGGFDDNKPLTSGTKEVVNG